MDYMYCERTTNYLFAEPLNATSNLFFIISAYVLKRKHNVKDNIFSYLIYFIGISSFFWHIFNNNLTAFLDTLSIILFISIYLFRFYYRIFKLSYLSSIFLITFFIIFSILFSAVFNSSVIGSSSFYLPILSHLFLNYLLLKLKVPTLIQLKSLLYASLIFSISIILRYIDEFICTNFIYGTHFLWHGLNSIVLYLVCNFMLVTDRSSPKKPS